MEYNSARTVIGRSAPGFAVESSGFREQRRGDGENRIRVVGREVIRRLPGGSQAHLIGCSDGHQYAVKFANNPHGRRALVCELLGSLLAEALLLPIQPFRIVEIPSDLVAKARDLTIELENGRRRCAPGNCFGSRFPCSKKIGEFLLVTVLHDLIPADCNKFENFNAAFGAYVFDQWTCNTDTRQFLCFKGFKDRRWHFSLLDQDRCFNGNHWNFPESPLWGLHHGLFPAIQNQRWEQFEPFLTRLEREMDAERIWAAVKHVPTDWLHSDSNALKALVSGLEARRQKVRNLIWTAMKGLPGRVF